MKMFTSIEFLRNMPIEDFFELVDEIVEVQSQQKE